MYVGKRSPFNSRIWPDNWQYPAENESGYYRSDFELIRDERLAAYELRCRQYRNKHGKIAGEMEKYIEPEIDPAHIPEMTALEQTQYDYEGELDV